MKSMHFNFITKLHSHTAFLRQGWAESLSAPGRRGWVYSEQRLHGLQTLENPAGFVVHALWPWQGTSLCWALFICTRGSVDNLWAETNKWMSQKILWWNLSIFLPLSVSHPSVPSSFPSSFFPFSLSPHHLPFLPLLFPFPSLSPSLSSLFKKAM